MIGASETSGEGRERSAVPTVVIEPSGGWHFIDWREIYEYRDLFSFLIYRSMRTRYAQSALGISWAIVQPVAQTVVFTIIFGSMLRVDSGGAPYALFSLVALVPWTYFQSAMTQSAQSLSSEANMISKIYFPRLILPLARSLARLLDFAIAMVILVALLLFYYVVGMNREAAPSLGLKEAQAEVQRMLVQSDVHTASAWLAFTDETGPPADVAGLVRQLLSFAQEHPDSAAAQLALARGLTLDGQADEAREIAGSVVARQPESGWAMYVLGAAELARGQRQEGVAWLEKADEALPDERSVGRLLSATRRVEPNAGLIVLPVLVVVMVLAATGIGLFLSALAVQYRDINHGMGFFMELMKFGSPVIFMSGKVQEHFPSMYVLYALNPMVGVIEGFRAGFLGNRPMPWMEIGLGALSAVALFFFGCMYFRRKQRVFADVA